MTSPAAWPPSLSGTPTVAVLEQAIARDRLSHSLLLHGDDLEMLEGVARAIGARLLHGTGEAAGYQPQEGSGGHPDRFDLRPAGRGRQISADATRELISRVQVSAAVGRHKVAVIHEADRMNAAAANIFLKTLEEPPAHTTILLLTRRPYALLPTIRSRVLHFRFPPGTGTIAAEGWEAWISDYRAWLEHLAGGTAARADVPDLVMTIYGLLARFGVILDRSTDAAWEEQRGALPADLDDDEREAVEAGISRGLRVRLLADVARSTRDFAMQRITSGDHAASAVDAHAFAAAIRNLEHNAGLLELNLNESAALENFLLTSMRIWARR